MDRVAVLGLGAMGRRMARRLVAAGHEVSVWNRSGVPIELDDARVRRATSPRDAATGADVVLCMVTNDEASRAVWTEPVDGALAGLREAAVAIECSTLTPPWISSLASQIEDRGAAFLDAPVVGSRLQADAGALVHLVGGKPEDLERARPVLSAVSDTVHYLGPSPAGTVAKLAVNALFGAQVALLAELLAFARRGQLDVGTFVGVLGALPVMSPAMKVAANGMLAAKYEPQFPIALVAKDFSYAVAYARALGADVPMTGRARDAFEQALAGGLGTENITAVAKLYV